MPSPSIEHSPERSPFAIGDLSPHPFHRLRFSRTDLAAIRVDTRQQRNLSREFGIEPFALAYGIEQTGTGIGMGNILRYDAYLCLYERTDLERLALTEQATSDPVGASPFAWEKLEWADRHRVVLLLPYGDLVGHLKVDLERKRLLIMGGSSSSSFTVFRDGITFKPTSFKGFSKVLQEEGSDAPIAAYELNRFSEWKEQTEAIGRLFILD